MKRDEGRFVPDGPLAAFAGLVEEFVGLAGLAVKIAVGFLVAVTLVSAGAILWELLS